MGGFAWVTLATNDSYSLGALVLAHSLRQVGTAHNLVVLVTPGVTPAMREKLSQVFTAVQEVNILDSKDQTNLRLLKRPELGVTFTKLHCWRLTQYDKCVFLDADTLVLQNCDELFEREELSAAPDVGWPDCFNSGVFVYRPSNETFEKLIEFALEKGSFDGGDQGLLNLYFADWSYKDISKHLPFIYNLCSTASYSYLPAYKQFGQNAKIVHFIGSTKPWLQYFDSESKKVRPAGDFHHLTTLFQHWWDLFCAFIHPNLTREMAGLAGALSQLTLGSPRTAEQSALEDHLRRQCWEVGNIDYLGRDSFDNIWSKICETINQSASETTEPPATPPKEELPAGSIETKPTEKSAIEKSTIEGPLETDSDTTGARDKLDKTPDTSNASSETPSQPQSSLPESIAKISSEPATTVPEEVKPPEITSVVEQKPELAEVPPSSESKVENLQTLVTENVCQGTLVEQVKPIEIPEQAAAVELSETLVATKIEASVTDIIKAEIQQPSLIEKEIDPKIETKPTSETVQAIATVTDILTTEPEKPLKDTKEVTAQCSQSDISDKSTQEISESTEKSKKEVKSTSATEETKKVEDSNLTKVLETTTQAPPTDKAPSVPDSRPSIPEQIPSPESSACPLKSTPPAPETAQSSSTTPETTPTAPQSIAPVPASTPTEPGSAAAAPASTPTTPVSTPAVPECTPIVTDSTSTAPGNIAVQPESISLASKGAPAGSISSAPTDTGAAPENTSSSLESPPSGTETLTAPQSPQPSEGKPQPTPPPRKTGGGKKGKSKK